MALAGEALLIGEHARYHAAHGIRDRHCSDLTAGLVQSAHDLSEGGLAVALAETTFTAKNLGLEVTVTGSPTTALFAETQSRFVVTVKPPTLLICSL